MTTELQTPAQDVVVKPKRGTVAPQECWHFCPLRISAACQERRGDWQHPVSHIAKIDNWERICPDCKEQAGEAEPNVLP